MNLAYSKNFQKLNLLSTKTRKKRKNINNSTSSEARIGLGAMHCPAVHSGGLSIGTSLPL